MFKLNLEKAEESEISCQHPLDQRKSRRAPEKNIYFCFFDYAKAFDCVDHNEFCLLRNLYAHQEAIVRTRHGTTDWFQTGKGARQGCILSSCLFNLYACKMPGWVKHKLESRWPGEISITSDMQMTPLLWHRAKKN